MASKSALLLACLLLTLPGAARAQGNQGGGAEQQTGTGSSSGTDTGQRDAGRSGDGEGGRPDVQTAPVGAGTTDATTTGISEPSNPASEASGEATLPPLPQPELCDGYRDGDAYAWCLSVVLRDEDVEITSQGESR